MRSEAEIRQHMADLRLVINEAAFDGSLMGQLQATLMMQGAVVALQWVLGKKQARAYAAKIQQYADQLRAALRDEATKGDVQ